MNARPGALEKNRLPSLVFVGVQFGALAGLLLTGPLLASRLPFALIEGGGGLLGAWSIVTVGLGKFHVTPDPVPGARLVTRGPYGRIRHPMYAALLLATLPLVADTYSLFRLLLWCLLALDLLLKLSYEEVQLAKAHQGYAAYRARTKRLIPFLF